MKRMGILTVLFLFLAASVCFAAYNTFESGSIKSSGVTRIETIKEVRAVKPVATLKSPAMTAPAAIYLKGGVGKIATAPALKGLAIATSKIAAVKAPAITAPAFAAPVAAIKAPAVAKQPVASTVRLPVNKPILRR